MAEYVFRRKNKTTGCKETFKATAHIYLNQAKRAEETRKLQEILQGVLNDFGRTGFESMEQAEEWLASKAGKSQRKLFILADRSKANPSSAR